MTADVRPGAAPGAEVEARVARVGILADEAIREFGVRCFWSVPGLSSLVPVEKAKVAARLLQKYGGARGLRYAAEIEAELLRLEETPWR